MVLHKKKIKSKGKTNFHLQLIQGLGRLGVTLPAIAFNKLQWFKG